MALKITIAVLLVNILVTQGADDKNDLNTNILFKLGKLDSDLKTMEKQVTALRQHDGELNGQVEQLKKANAAHVAKEKELLGKVAGLGQQLGALGVRASALQGKLDAIEQQTQKQNMKAQQTDNRVSALEMKVNANENQLEDVRMRTAALTAKSEYISAFSAGPRDYVSKNHRGIIVFGHVRYMYGLGYNSLTGVFTAPVHGLYAFHVTIGNVCGGDTCTARIGVFVKNKEQGRIYVSSSERDVQSSNNLVWELKKGDKVDVRMINGNAKLEGASYTSFTGFLIRSF